MNSGFYDFPGGKNGMGNRRTKSQGVTFEASQSPSVQNIQQSTHWFVFSAWLWWRVGNNPMVVLKLAYRWSFVKLRGIRHLDYFYICPLHLVGSYHILCKLPANKRWTECLMGLFGFRIRELWSLLDKVCQYDWHQKTTALQWVPVVLKSYSDRNPFSTADWCYHI